MKHDFKGFPIWVLPYFISGWYMVETYGVEIGELLSVKTYQVIVSSLVVTFRHIGIKSLFHHHQANNQYACDD